jgi:AraC family transcriptional regulator, regulatory protein of adaptative response / methylated-DNA-[protein]-cysteine methyltransferase
MMMREIIRFAWGISPLGDFVVAMSDKGIVALEFSSMHAAMEDALRVRFPEAELDWSQEELADVLEIVAGVIDNPGAGCDLPLDLRGTPYEVKVWLMLRDIPPAKRRHTARWLPNSILATRETLRLPLPAIRSR